MTADDMQVRGEVTDARTGADADPYAWADACYDREY
jgi:hypothetical protein